MVSLQGSIDSLYVENYAHLTVFISVIIYNTYLYCALLISTIVDVALILQR